MRYLRVVTKGATFLQPALGSEQKSRSADPSPRRPGCPHYESQKGQVLARAKPLTDLRDRTEDADNVVANWLEGEQKNAKDFAYYPFKARAGFHTLIINQDAEPVAILKIDPW